MRQTTKATVANARKLRHAMTPPEARLWQILRSRPGGFKFRRQHPAGPYVVDFYSPAARLIVAIDGMVHEMGNNPARDEHRDACLRDGAIASSELPRRKFRPTPKPSSSTS